LQLHCLWKSIGVYGRDHFKIVLESTKNYYFSK
jgi:hypothetical protein